MHTAVPDPTHWANGELYRGFVAEAEVLEAQGHSSDEVADALLGLALHMSAGIHGPAAVGARLWVMAGLFIGEADRAERGTDGLH